MNKNCYIQNSLLIIEYRGLVQKFELSNILYIVTRENHTCIKRNSLKESVTTTSLTFLEKLLPDYYFRINKSVIINMYSCEY